MKRSLAAAGLAVAVAITLAPRAVADVKGAPAPYKHGDLALEGYLAVDESKAEKRPGVLVVHEWWGLNDYTKKRADMLAKLGYVALAVDMYGKGVVTKDPGEAGKLSGAVKGTSDRKLMRDRIAAGLEVLKAHKLCDASRTAAIGYCFGGTTVLELARSGADVKAVVSFHGGLGTPQPADAKTLKAKILACNGADDAFVPAKELEDFMSEMRAAKADYQLVHYSGAVHSFTNPEAGKFGIKGVDYDANADRRSWAAMRALFDEVFATK